LKFYCCYFSSQINSLKFRNVEIMRHLILASALVIGSSALFAQTAFAGPNNVPFGGSVTSACSFDPTGTIAGTLNTSTPGTMTSLAGTGALAGKAKVSCSGAAGVLNITGITKTQGPAVPADTLYNATVTPSGAAAVAATYAGPATGGAAVPGSVPSLLGSSTLTVDMNAISATQAFAAGTYGFTVDLTVTP
jgi:hypothetical protein